MDLTGPLQRRRRLRAAGVEIEIGWPHRPRRSVRERVGVAAGVGDAPGRDTRRRLGRVPRPVLRLTEVVHFYRCCAKGRGGCEFLAKKLNYEKYICICNQQIKYICTYICND